ncbi:hypothetical protein A2924_03455 [Candidatus Giovannonibacteria bacterium RIFCSPLOWO2_01_FULL_44_16]|uniref:50S ribosomal protein L35 n=1 Tax=Candidatus Giovannonibacteria bacterium RIFCSPLOWO2_01_FULL_44_16 TaxID=1798348 RepID=A0A1F5X4G1_9BACT|nr:MAG: hypothetical protein A2924_03455 [Candidatus Giovannonibacteria bacterium RIFCSPLOWO2_01_FULL_44_16]
MTKTTKSITKRFKLTKNGKILRMPSGINHFQAKKSRSKQLSNKGMRPLDKQQNMLLKSYLYH